MDVVFENGKFKCQISVPAKITLKKDKRQPKKITDSVATAKHSPESELNVFINNLKMEIAKIRREKNEQNYSLIKKLWKRRFKKNLNIPDEFSIVIQIDPLAGISYQKTIKADDKFYKWIKNNKITLTNEKKKIFEKQIPYTDIGTLLLIYWFYHKDSLDVCKLATDENGLNIDSCNIEALNCIKQNGINIDSCNIKGLNWIKREVGSYGSMFSHYYRVGEDYYSIYIEGPFTKSDVFHSKLKHCGM